MLGFSPDLFGRGDADGERGQRRFLRVEAEKTVERNLEAFAGEIVDGHVECGKPGILIYQLGFDITEEILKTQRINFIGPIQTLEHVGHGLCSLVVINARSCFADTCLARVIDDPDHDVVARIARLS